MSIEAISHVLKLDIARSSEKFILLCMANYADERGYCYPSVTQLERDTSQDRKTVMANTKRLVDSALLRDTGRRVGSTRQVVVYQIIGLPDSSRAHYVYKLTHPTTGEFYIGKRSFNGHPELDSYRGSGRWPMAMRVTGVPLVREVVATFDTSAEALAYEVQLFRQHDGDPLCRNEQTPSRLRLLCGGKSAENGPVIDDEESRFSGETVPLFPDNSPKNGTRNHQGTVRESISIKATGAPLRPDWVPEKPWLDFVAMRAARKRTAMTPRAIELLFAKLEDFHGRGLDLADILNASTRNEWTDIYAPKEPSARGKGESRVTERMSRSRAAVEAFVGKEDGR